MADESLVLVMAAASPTAEDIELSWGVRAGLATMGGVVHVNLPSLLDVDLPNAIIDGREMARAGIEAFDQLELSKAKARLTQASLALSGYQESGADVCTALFKLADIHSSLGEDKAVLNSFIRALRLPQCAGYEIEEPSPSLASIWVKAKAFVGQPSQGYLVIKKSKTRLAIFLNGRFIGMNQKTPMPIAAGVNHLRFSADGYGDQHRVIEVSPGRTVEMSVSL